MLWDVFCRVVDNFGDIGVCWRLSADLAARGHSVRLWADDASALAWMAPNLAPNHRVEVHAWSEAEGLSDNDALTPGDVVIEAFGCNPPEPFVLRMQRPQPPIWINLEYLSAEDWVERSHGLRSPVFSGPGAGLNKWFFYPGFTRATGGLLREPGVIEAREAFGHSPNARSEWLACQGVAPMAPGEQLLSLFCYEPAPVGELLDNLAQSGHPTRVLLTPGPATRLATQWLSTHHLPPTLVLHQLAHLTQDNFDRLLWACDLNFVRGEDSAVRALWAGKPHVWHIYPQDDGVHEDKLNAFMTFWMRDWPIDLANQVRGLWRCWNGLCGPLSSLPAPAWPLQDPRWGVLSLVSRQRLLEIPDLVTQLLGFIASPR